MKEFVSFCACEVGSSNLKQSREHLFGDVEFPDALNVIGASFA